MYQFIDTFNKILLNTVDFLFKKFPDDQDISYAHYQVEIAVKAVPQSTFKTVYDYILLYKKQITGKDELFFINLSETDDSLKCFALKDKWSLLTADEKNHLFMQFQKLLRIGQNIK